MGLAEWIDSFRGLHEAHKRGELSREDDQAYLAGREELARALLAAQRLSARPGETPRAALRAAVALQADIEHSGGNDRVVTLDVGAGGFSALFAKPPTHGEEVKFSLRIPGGADPVSGRARIVAVKQLPGNARAGFQFLNLDADSRERIEILVFDTVLGHLERR